MYLNSITTMPNTFNYGTKVEGPLLKALFVLCQTNAWLKVGGVEFEPHGLCSEHDYKLALFEYTELADVKAFFAHGNWGIRSAIKYRSLIFVNQVNGGDEWWTIKILPDGQLMSFESVSWGHMLERPNPDPRESFDGFMQRCLEAREVNGRIELA